MKAIAQGLQIRISSVFSEPGKGEGHPSFMACINVCSLQVMTTLTKSKEEMAKELDGKRHRL
jgi:hypothetical protein